MTNESAYKLVRRYIDAQFESHRRYIAIKDQAAARVERDRVLAMLATMRTEEPVQPTLLAEPIPFEYTPELSLKIDQMDKAIDTANGANDYARATALRARKSQMLRSIGA
jgi:hypothetical protein